MVFLKEFIENVFLKKADDKHMKNYQVGKESARNRLSSPMARLIGNIVVYVEWASRVNFVTIFGDLYQNKLLVICNNLNQFAHLSSASGPSNDVIKMAAIVLLRTYIRHRI